MKIGEEGYVEVSLGCMGIRVAPVHMFVSVLYLLGSEMGRVEYVEF